MFIHAYTSVHVLCLCVLHLMCVCVCVRSHAGDSEGFLEDGLAGKLGLHRHGYQPGGGGQGEFITQEFTKCVCVFDEEARYL